MNRNLTYLKFEVIDESLRHPNLVKVRERIRKHLFWGIVSANLISSFSFLISNSNYSGLERKKSELEHSKEFDPLTPQYQSMIDRQEKNIKVMLGSLVGYIITLVLFLTERKLTKFISGRLDQKIIEKVESIPEGRELVDTISHLKKFAKKMESDLRSDFKKIKKIHNLKNINFAIYLDYLVFQSYEHLNLLDYPEYRDKNSDGDFQTIQQQELYTARKHTSRFLLKKVEKQRDKLKQDLKRFYEAYQKLYDQGLV